MVVRRSHVYAVPMPFLTVRITGAPDIKMEVDEVEIVGTPPSVLIAKKANAQVGGWAIDAIVGWWLRDKDDDHDRDDRKQ